MELWYMKVLKYINNYNNKVNYLFYYFLDIFVTIVDLFCLKPID